MATKILKNEEGVNSVVEYIIVFIIGSIIFSIFLILSQSLFIENPSKTVSQNQFMDVGNDVDTKLVDTYLVMPDNGTISTTFDMPNDIAGYGYNVSIFPSGTNDVEVRVTSNKYNDVFADLTLNGVNSTIPINGSTSSNNAIHKIHYSSNVK